MSDLLVVPAFHETETDVPKVLQVVMGVADDAHDAADGLAVSTSKDHPVVAGTECGILLRVKIPLFVGVQRREPAGMALVKLRREMDERFLFTARHDFFDRYAHQSVLLGDLLLISAASYSTAD
jgi:hypothetical protein